MTKPIILVKICYKLLYIIQNIFDKVTSWPVCNDKCLSKFWSHLPVCNTASD